MVAAVAAARSILIPRNTTRIPKRLPLQQYWFAKALAGNICHVLQRTNLLVIFTCIILGDETYFMCSFGSIKAFSSVWEGEK
jgi:hypothetical protein